MTKEAISTKRALKLALEALEESKTNNDTMEFHDRKNKAITAIREALAEQPAPAAKPDCGARMPCGTSVSNVYDAYEAGRRAALAEQPAQPQQEPVAYAVYHRMGGSKSLHWPEQHSPEGDANEYQLLPLYTSPPTLSLAQRTWVGLTDEEIEKIWNSGVRAFFLLARAIEAKLKEKNSD